jgi:hypothetical protein
MKARVNRVRQTELLPLSVFENRLVIAMSFPGFQHRHHQRLIDHSSGISQVGHPLVQLPAKMPAAGATAAATAVTGVAAAGSAECA